MVFIDGKLMVELKTLDCKVDGVHDYLTGETSLVVSRAHGKSTFTKEYSSNQSTLDIITPLSGKRLCLSEIMTMANANSGTIALDFNSSSITAWRHYVARTSQVGQSALHIHGAVDEPLQLSTTTGNNDVFVIVNYRVVD